MTQFVVFDPRVEVNGQAFISIFDAIPEYRELVRGILQKNGLGDIRRLGWYPQQRLLDAFQEIASEIGGFTLYAIGRYTPENADWPTEVDSLEGALASIDVAYHLNHRIDGARLYDPRTGEMTEGIGHYRSSPLPERGAKVECWNPYPCDFDKGLIAATVNKFKDDRDVVSIREMGECRKRGAESCTYLVRW